MDEIIHLFKPACVEIYKKLNLFYVCNLNSKVNEPCNELNFFYWLKISSPVSSI